MFKHIHFNCCHCTSYRVNLMNELFCFHAGMLEANRRSPYQFHSTPDLGSSKILSRLQSVEGARDRRTGLRVRSSQYG